MVPSAYLRAFVPATTLDAEELSSLTTSPESDEDDSSWRQLADGSLGVMLQRHPVGGWRIERDGKLLVCPARTRLRSLVGMLALRDQYPDVPASHLVSDRLADAAADELESLRYGGRLRTHVLQAPWEVPLRWFLAFTHENRVVDAAAHALRYETTMTDALERVTHAAEVVESAGLEADMVGPVLELVDWLSEFAEDDAMLQLDYAGVGELLSLDELRRDESAEEIHRALAALESGEYERAGVLYALLAERWSAVRALESAN